MGMRDNNYAYTRHGGRRLGGCCQEDRRENRSEERGYGCGRSGRGAYGGNRGAYERYEKYDRTDERSGCGCRDNDLPARSGCGECHELMNRLQKLDFSIQETVLYLDAYPDCCEAKNYYHQLVKERQEVAHAYEKACGPLCAMGNVSTSSWDWTRAPWPWHPDFPGNGKA